MENKQADNHIEVEGARALSEALKTNTTLQSLDLSGEQEESGQYKLALMKSQEPG